MINPFKSKKGLGRGLSSLIGDSKTKVLKNKISVSSLIRNKYQPRKKFNKDSLDELTSSIKERGIIQPIVVRKSEHENDKYEIIAGERRWLAAQNAGLHEVPIVEVEADDLKSLEFAIVENVQRNCLRLLSLPKEVINLIEEGKLSQGHAKILVSLENAYFLAKKIIDKKLSVRQSENLVRLLKSKNKFKIVSKDSNIRELENILKDKIGVNVTIKNKKNNSGQIIFEYKDQDQLDHLIKVIKLNY
jgi:ParB family chromosome partitioning protein